MYNMLWLNNLIIVVKLYAIIIMQAVKLTKLEGDTKMYCKKLTKKELLDAGFTSVEYINDQWRVFRRWRKNNSKEKIDTEIKITLACGKHKYRPNKYYHKITYSFNRKVINIPLSRLIYVWFKGDIPDGYVVDHINNDSFDNRPENLQLLTVGDNLKKRFEDNEDAWVNQ